MTQQEKNDAVLVGLLFGFLLFFGLMEKQNEQTKRLREMRKRLGDESNNQEDVENLQKDWQKIREDLRKASEKKLSDVQ